MGDIGATTHKIRGVGRNVRRIGGTDHGLGNTDPIGNIYLSHAVYFDDAGNYLAMRQPHGMGMVWSGLLVKFDANF